MIYDEDDTCELVSQGKCECVRSAVGCGHKWHEVFVWHNRSGPNAGIELLECTACGAVRSWSYAND